MTGAPAPLTPPDCDLRDFPHMPLDVVRLRDSAIAAADPGAFTAAVMLWCSAWHQVPAASLPDDDVMLARLAGYGRDVRNWRRVRAKGALHGFVLCSDGRLYHPVVAEKANAAHSAKANQRRRTTSARAALRASIAASPALDPASTPPPPSLDPASTLGAAAMQAVVERGQPIDNARNAISVTDDKTPSKGELRKSKGKEEDSVGLRPTAQGAPCAPAPPWFVVGPNPPQPARPDVPPQPGLAGAPPQPDRPPDRPDAPPPPPRPPPTIRDALWRDGPPILHALIGLGDRAARALLGRLLREARDDAAAVHALLHEARSVAPAEPQAWLMAAARSRGGGAPRVEPKPGRLDVAWFDREMEAAGYYGPASSPPAAHDGRTIDSTLTEETLL